MAFDPDEFLASKRAEQANEESAPASAEASGDFNIDKFLDTKRTEAQVEAPVEATLDKATGPVEPDSKGAQMALEAVSPAVTAYGYGGPTGMKDLGRAVKAGVSPYTSAVGESLGKTAAIYKAHPIMAPAIEAAGTAMFGAPPIATAQQAMGAWDKLQAAKQGVQGAGQVLSEGAPATTPVKGLPTTATKGPFAAMRTAAGPELGSKLSALWNEGAGNNSVRSWLTSAEGKAAQAANPELAAKAAEYLKVVPTYGQQAMKVVSPFLKGAARVAGPVGNAMLGYDMVNQFAENKQQIEANPRAPGLESNPYAMTLRGEAPSVAAAGAMNQRAVLSRPTPMPLSPQEASNLLQSDDQRTINIYGGRAHLEALVKSGIRQKAASKVLGPIAPGQ